MLTETTTQSFLQGTRFDKTFEIGSPPQIPPSISTPRAMLAMKALPCGSFKAIPSQIGNHLDHCCGSTENVRLSTSPSSLLLTDFHLRSGFRKECTQVRVFRPRLIMVFIIDNPLARPLSRILSPSATQDPLI